MNFYWHVILEEANGNVKVCTTHNDMDQAFDRANSLNENLEGFYTVVPFGWSDEEILNYPISTSRLIFKSKAVTGKSLKNTNEQELIELKRYIMKNYNV